jgi:hypothetical protein
MKTHNTRPAIFGCLTTYLCLTLSMGATAAHATQFSTFQLITVTNWESVNLRDDAYPGKIAIANRSNQPLCIDFKILDGQNKVLRYSKLRVPIPAGRTDLTIIGPGDNARRIHMHVDVGARPPCGASSDRGFFFNISPGEVTQHSWPPVNFDASRWGGAKRDVQIDVRQP